jgi:hypothetical protein
MQNATLRDVGKSGRQTGTGQQSLQLVHFGKKAATLHRCPYLTLALDEGNFYASGSGRLRGSGTCRAGAYHDHIIIFLHVRTDADMPNSSSTSSISP